MKAAWLIAGAVWLFLAGCGQQSAQDESAHDKPAQDKPAHDKSAPAATTPEAPTATRRWVAPPPANEQRDAQVAHLLVRYEGAVGSHGVSRTRDQAQARAQSLHELCTSVAAFDSLTREHSEDQRSRDRGGWLEPFAKPENPDNVLHAEGHRLKVGEISGVIETVEGFHILYRGPLEFASSRNILISYQDSILKRADITRSKARARALADSLHARLTQHGDDLVSLARNFSDGPGAGRGGEVPTSPRGVFVGSYERALFGLSPGEISPVVETIYGFHIIQRLP